MQTNEPGALGYNLGPDYFLIDELGLISPGVSQALMRQDYRWAFDRQNPDYLICSWEGMYSACEFIESEPGYARLGEVDRDFWEQYLQRGATLYGKLQ